MARLTLKTDKSDVTLEIGTEEHREGAHIRVYAGGNEYKTGQAVYEADKGFVILEAIPRVISQWGKANWSTSLTGRDSNVEKIEKISRYFEELMEMAEKKGDEENQQMAHWVQKQILDYYFKYSSTNARFEVNVECKSEEIRLPILPPLYPKIDTKTANLEMAFTFRLLKLITPEEMIIIKDFMADAIGSGQKVDYEYA